MEEAHTSSFDEFRECLIYETDKCSKESSGFIARSTKDNSIAGAVVNCDLADTHTEAANPTSQHIYMNRLVLDESIKLVIKEI